MVGIGFGLEPGLVLVEGKWEACPEHHQATNQEEAEIKGRGQFGFVLFRLVSRGAERFFLHVC